ncbi:Elongation complex protein 6 [Rhizoctonia solani]|uniref:Elongation complex protein 6 n=1 Tax=Rhizoctonia solani TaxID=456999 RepID=A0A8H7M111_9AGAM|nr:Elongation complex protein 6 [Rhizoctonia solani]
MLSVVKGLTFPPSRLGPAPTAGNTIRHFVPQIGQVLLITDTPASSAQFLVQAVLQSQLKREGEASANTRACVLVSVDHDFAHISAVAARSNLNLSHCIRDRTLVYVDALTQAPQPLGDLADGVSAPDDRHTTAGIVTCPPLATSLRPLYDVIQQALEQLSPSATGKLLILSDVSSLEWIGIPATEVSSGVVILYHSPSRDLPIESDVFRNLLTGCDVHAEVRELSSGLSSAVSGEVALHPGFTAPDPHFVPIPRERALQYRLTDAGVIWFDRGTSAGVL